jgi:hypothetical protein
MLYLSTSGYNYSKKRCEKIVDWFVSKYLSRYKIEIEVLHRGLLREGVYGWCTVQDCDWKPRCFLIELHNFLSVEDYTKTLLHELQHVLQHVRGDLKDKGQKRLWKGIDCSDLDYDEMPWEQEAHKLEEILYHEYLTNCQ